MVTGSELHPGRAALLLSIVVAGAVFWDSTILLPFKLLSVMGHETGHALTSLIVGGSVERVTLRLDESGACLSRVPRGFLAQAAVFSAGYVGSAIISGLLLILSFRFNARRVMLAVACLWLALMGMFYARDTFTLLFTLIMAVLFGAGARWLPDAAVGGLNLFTASFAALYALMDLKDDLWNPAVRSQSDAQLLGDITGVPALIWAALWTLVSVGLLLGGGWAALRGRKVSPTSPVNVMPASR